MPFVARNQNGDVVGVFSRPQPGRAEERLPEDAPEVVAFRNRKPPPNPLAAQIRAEPSLNQSVKNILLSIIGESP